jgi:hypothetical protein
MQVSSECALVDPLKLAAQHKVTMHGNKETPQSLWLQPQGGRFYMALPALALGLYIIMCASTVNVATGQGLSNPKVALGAAELGATCQFGDFEALLEFASATTGRGRRRKDKGDPGPGCLQASLQAGQVR